MPQPLYLQRGGIERYTQRLFQSWCLMKKGCGLYRAIPLYRAQPALGAPKAGPPAQIGGRPLWKWNQ